MLLACSFVTWLRNFHLYRSRNTKLNPATMKFAHLIYQLVWQYPRENIFQDRQATNLRFQFTHLLLLRRFNISAYIILKRLKDKTRINA